MGDYELYHWGVKGMKWGVRRYQNADGSLTPAGEKRYTKPSTPYHQDLGGGVTAVWPSKKVYKQAERKRLRTEKKTFNADVKEYEKRRSDFADSITRSVNRKTTEQDRGDNTLKLLKVKEFVDQKTATRGREYVDKIIDRADKRQRAKNGAVLGGFIVSMTAAAAGVAYLESRFG